MKRLISLLLVAAMIFAFAATGASASFDKSVFENSRKFKMLNDGGWAISGMYAKNYSKESVEIYAILDDDCVKDGTGPKLVFVYFNKELDSHNIVTAFKAIVDGIVFEFTDLDSEDPQASAYNAAKILITEDYGYMHCGKVAKQFLKSLESAKKIAFFYTYEDIFGESYIRYDDEVSTGSVSQLVDLYGYFKNSRVWDTVDDMDAVDEKYGATMEKAP